MGGLGRINYFLLTDLIKRVLSAVFQKEEKDIRNPQINWSI